MHRILFSHFETFPLIYADFCRQFLLRNATINRAETSDLILRKGSSASSWLCTTAELTSSRQRWADWLPGVDRL